MASNAVVIVGGGIVGMVTAYYLAKAGAPSVVVERDAIGSHASGFAYGGLSPLSGFGIPGPLAEVAQDGVRPSLALAFTEADAQRLRAALPWQQQQPGYAARWLDSAEAHRVEPRIADETIGAVSIEGTADVEPYRLVLALTKAAVPSAPGRPASESGTLCHGDGAQGRGHRRQRAFMLPILILQTLSRIISL